MTTAYEPGNADIMKQHHGDIIYEPSGFVKKIYRKDAKIHQAIVNTYTDMWKADKKDAANREENIENRLEHAQMMRWGESFHFARLFKGDTFEQSIKRHEQYLSLKLGLSRNSRTLDVGCGVGGPLREIVRLSGAHVTGLNNNAYQIERCKTYSKKFGLESMTDFVKGDFTNIPCELYNKFDTAYAVEATVHSPKLEIVYGEVFRALKPGGLFAVYEWVTTSIYDDNNPDHRRIIHGIEEGNAVPKLSSYIQALDAAKKVGFEIVEYEDMAILDECHEPWYNTLKGKFSLTDFKMTRIGRWTTHKFVAMLELLGIAASGSTNVSSVLMNAADALVEGGETGIFTPMFFILLRKPKDA
ncbi:5840_t:CDS:2 [Paraglomus occultum]|uniref:5840_t:CDS:1 n=1 Tax=Paraglomus occultum TaxID=144539 RepID=A0A9N9C7F6_9GLOM|nr:5840_t:CDS:2 [Paraglomus occultum]